jgi:PAS domain S-box-containing protein
VSNRQEIERAAFEEVLRQMPARVVVAEAPSGEIIFVNSRSQQEAERGGAGDLHGRSVFEALHSTVFSALHSDGRPYEIEEWPLIRSITSGEEVRGEEIIYLLPDGTQTTVRYNSSPIYDDEGRVVAGVVVGYDITEQKLAEVEQRESKRRIEDILESITDEFIALDREWCFTYINERGLLSAQGVKGQELTREEVMGKNVWDMFPVHVGSVIYNKYHEAMREQKTVHFEAYSPLTDRWLELHVYPSEAGLSVYSQDITERKLAEEKLRRSEERFRLLVEGVRDYAIFMLDTEGHIVSWNEGARRIKGYGQQEILGRHFSIFYPPEDVERGEPERGLREAQAKGVNEEEGWRVRKDGSRFWASVLITALRDEAGQLRSFAKVTRDITERKLAEEELKESSRRTEHILESITDEFYAFDREWRFTYLNERALRRMQSAKGQELTREDVLGKILWEKFPEQVSSVLYEKYHEAVREQKTMELETYSPFTDRWLEVHLYPSEEGASLYVHDITERKRAEEQLRYHASLLENVHDAVIATDEHLAVTAWNKGAEEMYGWRADEVLGRHLWEAVPLDLSEEQRAEALGELSERGRLRTEVITHGKGGTPIWVEGITIALRGGEQGDGEITGYVNIRRDISERKEAEKELESRCHQQAVVAELGLRAMANDDLQSLMDEAVALVARTLDAEYSEVVEVLSGGEELLIVAGVGWDEGVVGDTLVSAGFGSQASFALISEEPVIVEDLATETRFEPPSLLVEHGTVSGMSVVIHGQQRPYGVICADTTSRRTFSQDDVNFLQAVANVLAMAIERKRAQQKLEEVREAERSRIARDLHDDALQDVSGALVDAQRLEAISSEPEAARLSERLLATLDRVGPHLRGAIYDLSLEREQDRPFHVLLETMVELQRTMAPHLQIALEVQEGIFEGSLGETGREILRIIGEALTNARRHSGAKNVLVRVEISEGILYAEVKDDGRSFDPTQEESTSPSATGGGGVGMRSMRERAQNLGGMLMTESEPGEGTKVRFELALERELDEAEEDEVRVLLVEDHASIREALASTFEGEGFEVVGQAGSMAEAQRMLEEIEQAIDVALIDLGLPDGYGADLIKELHEKNPQAQALVLSASLDRANIARAVELGAAGILSKTAHLDEVVQAVRRLKAGETLMPLEEVVGLLRFAGSQREQEYEARQAIAALTPREIEVLQALAEGLDSEGIAEKLNIALRTERNHMASILAKLGVHSQLQALVFALRYGVAEVP